MFRLYSYLLLASMCMIVPAYAEEGEAVPVEIPPMEEVPLEVAPVEGVPMEAIPAVPVEADAAGEEGDETPVAQAPALSEEAQERKSGIAKLKLKLTKKDGSPAVMGVITPLDYTTLDYADLAETTILQSLSRYGDLTIRKVNATPGSLTLEEFRKLVSIHKIDVVVITVLKPTNFDMFLYDRRTPYNIYAHSEILPEEVQYKISPQVLEEYTKVIIRRVLYAYSQDKFYELPRDEVKPLLASEVPRWVASSRNLAMLNREITSRYYISANMGAALAFGNNKIWNSNLVGLQLGFRLFSKLYAEAAIDLFSYTAFIGSLKYYFTSKDSPFQIAIGAGLAKTTNSRTLNFDQAFTQGEGGNYIVPSFAANLPIVDVHFKIEGKLYYGLGGGRMMIGLMPGLMVLF